MPTTPQQAAIVTGGSRGIGYAIAEALAQAGYALTLSARRPEALEQAASRLAGQGHEVQQVVANLLDEAAVQQLVAAHRERYGRLDVLVNNAGVGIGAPVAEQQTKFVDLQIGVNLRSIILMYRETVAMLRQAGSEHRRALVVNLASIGGKYPEAWLSVYSATKAAVIAYTVSMNKELGREGIRSVALCPGWVDTDMTEFMRSHVPQEEMIPPGDIAEAVRFLLGLSPNTVIPEISFQRPGDTY